MLLPRFVYRYASFEGVRGLVRPCLPRPTPFHRAGRRFAPGSGPVPGAGGLVPQAGPGRSGHAARGRRDRVGGVVEPSRGVTAPRERIEALVLKPTAPRDRSEEEIAGYRDALNLIHESAPHMTFSSNVILQLHGMLYRYHPGLGGRWKMAPNEIVERNADGSVRRVRFVPVSPIGTPGAMDQLVAGY